MSQYGAYGRALPIEDGGGGQPATDILNFYYPTASITPDTLPEDLKVHIFSGLGAELETSGEISIKNSQDEVFATLTDPTTLTVDISSANNSIEINDGNELMSKTP